MNFSRHFNSNELLRSVAYPALASSVERLPWQYIVMLSSLCCDVLQPMRDQIASPIHVLSGYRGTALNRAVGGGEFSRHQIGVNGQLFAAADINSDILPPEAIFAMLAIADAGVKFDRVCLYPGRGFLHIDVQAHELGPPSKAFFVDTGNGWNVVSRQEAARSTW